MNDSVRKNGFYWIRRKYVEMPEIAKWNTNMWWVIGSSYCIPNHQIGEVGKYLDFPTTCSKCCGFHDSFYCSENNNE